MHLDLQSIINYITIGIVVTLLVITVVSITTNKLIASKKKKEEEKLEAQAVKQNYKSSQVYTYSVPENFSAQNPAKKTMEREPKKIERFQVVNDTFHRTTSSYNYKG